MQIRELYVEPTSRCNLSCAICSRNHWDDERIGDLDFALFEKAIRELNKSAHRVFFGGVGEPLVHPEIIKMIQTVKESGRSAEIISNGTLLDDSLSRKLLDAKLDKLWVSLDWVDEGDGDDNLGHRSDVLQRMLHFSNLSKSFTYSKQNTKLAAMFVLMKRNRHQLDALITRAKDLGIDEIKVTHLLAYDASMEDEICYGNLFPVFSSSDTKVDLPFMDIKSTNSKIIQGLLVQGRYANAKLLSPKKNEYCRFIQDGVTFLRWDGEICPCMPLLHTNTVFQKGHQRKLVSKSFGSLKTAKLQNIWSRKEYSDFRSRVIDFNFSPCVTCGGCGLFEVNNVDCIGSPSPTCGHCLWAYGLIQCP